MSDRPASQSPHKPSLSDDEPAVQISVLKVSTTQADEVTAPDWVASEAPLEVRIGGIPTTVLMRTPGHDEELVRGFLYGEGGVTSADQSLSLGTTPLSPVDS